MCWTPSAPHLGPWGLSIQSEWVSGAERVSLGSVAADASPQAAGWAAAAARDFRKVRRVAVMVVGSGVGVGGELDFLFQKSLILGTGRLSSGKVIFLCG